MRFIGSKASLLENIQKVIDENVKDNSEVFCDIFAGTNSVGYYFKPRYKIIGTIVFIKYIGVEIYCFNSFFNKVVTTELHLY